MTVPWGDSCCPVYGALETLAHRIASIRLCSPCTYSGCARASCRESGGLAFGSEHTLFPLNNLPFCGIWEFAVGGQTGGSCSRAAWRGSWELPCAPWHKRLALTERDFLGTLVGEPGLNYATGHAPCRTSQGLCCTRCRGIPQTSMLGNFLSVERSWARGFMEPTLGTVAWEGESCLWGAQRGSGAGRPGGLETAVTVCSPRRRLERAAHRLLLPPLHSREGRHPPGHRAARPPQ